MAVLALSVSAEVRAAQDAGHGVVALESTLVAHGLPRPDNLRVARRLERLVRDRGAVPATIAVVAGRPTVGLDDDELTAVATRDDVVKTSTRDLAPVLARGGWGATTVASTALLAARAGIPVFATGGLGGVHREASRTWDESADLLALSRTPVVVVCAGVKSILDVPATLERLETYGVGVVGWRTNRFPGFYLTDSGQPLHWRVDDVDELAAVVRAWRAVGDGTALVVANPLPADRQLDPRVHDDVLRESLAAADRDGVHGKDVTPRLLADLHRRTDGESLRANVELVEGNVALAADLATALAEDGT